MHSRRTLILSLALVLIIVVGAAAFTSYRDQSAARQVTTIRGLVGSEKEEFFQDARVIEELRRNGLVVEIVKAGSRQIATTFDLTEYDFAFPAGEPAAEKMRREYAIADSYDAFYTPMAIATWKPIADILVTNQVAIQEDGYYVLDMARYLELVKEGRRWSELEGNDAFNIDKSILVTSTDVRYSNSAAMYLALASFVANGNRVVQNDSEINDVMPLMLSLFYQQGYTAYSSEVPFDDYLTMGMGKAPMVMIYESQFLYQSSLSDGSITDDMVLMYPSPNIFTKHILVPLTEEGAQLTQLFEHNSQIRRLAVEHGFRTNDADSFREFTAGLKINIPHDHIEFVGPPVYEVLEQMLAQIDLYHYRTFILGK